MNAIQAEYPLLLTSYEPGTAEHHYQDYPPCRGDVFQANYTQGDRLEDDALSDLRKVAAKRNVDEVGVGWQDGHRPLVLSGHQLQLRTGRKWETLLKTEAQKVAVSASQRYFWALEKNDSDTALKQFDSATGEWQQIPWQADRYANIALAPDTRQDRLLFFHNGNGEATEMLSWTPSQTEVVALNCPITGPIYDPALSPDGEKLAYVRGDEVYAYDFASGKTDQVSSLDDQDEEDESFNEFRQHFSPQWSPDGKRIFYTLYSAYWEEETIDEYSALFVATPNGQERQVLLPCYERVNAVQVGRS